MSESNKDANFSFKVLINTQKTKVLFAEIDSDFANVLFSFLTLPLGKIVRILKKHYGDEAPFFGSLTTLYDGLSNLDEAHFSLESCKQMLLNPPSSFPDECCKLKIDIGDSQPTKYFSCENLNCGYSRKDNICMHYGTGRCRCGKQLKKEIRSDDVFQDVGKVFTRSTSTYILSDDLEILSNVMMSVRKIVSNLGLMGLDGTELRNVTFGFNEIMELLLCSLLANHYPLTEVILKNQTKFEPVPVRVEDREVSTDEGLTINAILQKSTNKLLFVEAGEDFVEFLFCLLIIPLGKVESLLCGNTCMMGVDNLYRSIAFPIECMFPRNAEKSRLINPTIPFGYGSKKHIFPVVEECFPQLGYNYSGKGESLFAPNVFGTNCTIKPPKGELDYLKGPRRYMVKDDLTVTTLCMTSYISMVTEPQITFSDVQEKTLKIGLKEASSILKASLTSTCALSNGLNHLLMK